MALRAITVTLGATATRAITAHTPISFLMVESETGNADVKIGGSGVSATDYGAIVTAGPNNAKRIGPFPHGITNLDEFYFLGTDTQKIHLLAITP